MNFYPTASLRTLEARAKLLDTIREFFRDHEYLEVETPVLSRDVVIDAYLDPFEIDIDGERYFLQTSPEFAMKRLLVAGAEAIFQITHAFRAGEVGKLHNPEFTMIEWYRVGDTYHDQMEFSEKLVRRVFSTATRILQGRSAAPTIDSSPFERLSYDDAFNRFAGRKVLESEVTDLRALACKHNVQAPDSFTNDDKDNWLNLLLAEVVEPEIAKLPPTFLLDYPASQSALARVRNDIPPVAERFELYVNGIELCNGYQELTDAAELVRRNDKNSDLRVREGSIELPKHSALIDAMNAGLPECSGVALGFDRLAMLALGCESLGEVIPFAFDRA